MSRRNYHGRVYAKATLSEDIEMTELFESTQLPRPRVCQSPEYAGHLHQDL